MESNEYLTELKEFSKILAEISGKIIKSYFQKELSVDTKPDGSPVTIADQKSEEAMRELISRYYPEHAILGEEHGYSNKGAEFTWVLDPIDGTKSFICGVELFGTLIAVLQNEKPILGVIHLPVLDKLIIGDNNITMLDQAEVQVRDCPDLSQAVLLTTDHCHVGAFHHKELFDKLIAEAGLYRTWGDCYGYSLVARGKADIMIDPIVSPWDVYPVIPVIKGAGGVISDFQGNDPVRGSSVVAAAPNIHSKIIQLLNP